MDFAGSFGPKKGQTLSNTFFRVSFQNWNRWGLGTSPEIAVSKNNKIAYGRTFAVFRILRESTRFWGSHETLEIFLARS